MSIALLGTYAFASANASVSQSITVPSGTDYVLLSAFGYNGTFRTLSTSPAIGGSELTVIEQPNNVDSNQGKAQWILARIVTPSEGAQTFTITWSGSFLEGVPYLFAFYSGVDPTTPERDSSSSFTFYPDGPITNVRLSVTSAIGDYPVFMHNSWSGGANTPDLNILSQTVHVYDSALETYYALISKAAGDGTTQFGIDNVQYTSQGAVSLIPAAGIELQGSLSSTSTMTGTLNLPTVAGLAAADITENAANLSWNDWASHEGTTTELPYVISGPQSPNGIWDLWRQIDSIKLGDLRYQAVSYWNINEKLTIGVRTIDPDTDWTYYVYDGTGGLPDINAATGWDTHHGSVIGLDSDGYLHICTNLRSSALSSSYRRSDAPVNTWTGGVTAGMGMLGTNEGRGTYPTFFRDPLDTLYFAFRDGGSGDGNMMFYGYDPSTSSWSAGVGAAGLLIDGKDSSRNPYWGEPIFTRDWDGAGIGRMWFTYNWRATTNPSSGEHVCVISWDGTNWYQSDGTAQTIPATYANCDIIADSGGLWYPDGNRGLAVGDNGKIVLENHRNFGSGFVPYISYMDSPGVWASVQLESEADADFAVGDPIFHDWRAGTFKMLWGDLSHPPTVRLYDSDDVTIDFSGGYATFNNDGLGDSAIHNDRYALRETGHLYYAVQPRDSSSYTTLPWTVDRLSNWIDLVGWTVEYQEQGNAASLQTVVVTDEAYAVSGLSADTTYEWRVTAKRGGVTDAISSWSSFTTTTSPTTNQELSGALSSTSTASGDITAARTLSGSLSSESAISAVLTVSRELVGSLSGTSTASGSVAVARTLAGALTSIGELSGRLTVGQAILLAGSLESTSTMSGDILIGRALSGTLASQQDAEAAITVARTLAGTLSSQSFASGNLIAGAAYNELFEIAVTWSSPIELSVDWGE